MNPTYQKHKRLFAFINIALVIAIIGATCILLTFLIVFVPMLVLGGDFTLSSGGILGFFLEVMRDGDVPIESSDMVLAASPAIVGLFCLLGYLMSMKTFFGKMMKHESIYYKGADKRLFSMTVLCFVWAFLPRVLSEIAEKQINGEMFHVQQWNVIGYLVLAFAMLCVSVAYKIKLKKSKNEMIGE